MVGIGGPGMSALARSLVAMGHHVSGSDIRPSENIAQLKGLGINNSICHNEELVVGCEAVCASSGVPSDNIEMAGTLCAGVEGGVAPIVGDETTVPVTNHKIDGLMNRK